MGVYAGLDISLDAVAICVVRESGELLWHGKVLGEPDAVSAALGRWRGDLVRVGLEAGATSEWIEAIWSMKAFRSSASRVGMSKPL